MTVQVGKLRPADVERRLEKLQQLRRLRAEIGVADSPAHTVFRPLPHQVPPDGDWSTWFLMGGRGSGKTEGGAFATEKHVKGPACLPRLPGGHRVAIVAPTLGDAGICVEGPAGLRAHDPRVRLVTRLGGAVVRWPSGAEGRLFGAHTPSDVDRLRAGGNTCFAWLEEFAAFRYMEDAFDHLTLGLRLGPHPRKVITTTPRPRPLIVALHDKAVTGEDGVVLTRATIFDNPYLDPSVKEAYVRAFEGTRRGRQELYGELLTDVGGALWTHALLDAHRVPSAPRLTAVAVGVDPSAWGPDEGAGTTAGKHDTPLDLLEGKGVETGVVAAGLGVDGHVYVLDDLSGRVAPAEWGARAVDVAARHGAFIAAETNLAKGMVLHVIRSTAGSDRVRVVPVHAADAKRARAEPVAALYEQGRAHHVGTFPVLEDQMASWMSTENWSPDRIDALVHAVTALNPWGPRQATLSKASGTLPRPGTMHRPAGAQVLPPHLYPRR